MNAERPLPITFPLHGTRLIEASAGTGKTFTLAALYLRLVLSHGDDGDNNKETNIRTKRHNTKHNKTTRIEAKE